MGKAQQNGTLDALASRVGSNTVGVLGHIVWHAIPDVRIAERDLIGLAQKHGLAKPPTMGSKADAFRRATSPTARRGEGRQTRFLVRPVVNTGEKLVRHVVIERVNAVGERLDHFAAGEMVFHHATEAMDVAWLPGITLEDSERREVAKMLTEAESLFAEYTTSMTGDELTRFVMRRLDDLSYVTVHPRGAVYFIPAAHHAAVSRIAAFVRELDRYSKDGNKAIFHIVPLLDEDDQRGMVKDGLAAGVQRDLTSFAAEMAELLARPSKPDLAVAEHRVSQLATLRGKVREYADLLGMTMATMESAIDIAQAQATVLVDRAASNDDALVTAVKSAGVEVELKKKTAKLVSGYREIGLRFNPDGWTLSGTVCVREELTERPEYAEVRSTGGGTMEWSVKTSDPEVAMLYVRSALKLPAVV